MQQANDNAQNALERKREADVAVQNAAQKHATTQASKAGTASDASVALAEKETVDAMKVAQTASKQAAAASQAAVAKRTDHQEAVAKHLPQIGKRLVNEMEVRSVQQAKTQRVDTQLAKVQLPKAVQQHQRMAEGTVQEVSVLARTILCFAELSDAKEPSLNTQRMHLGKVHVDGREVSVELVGKCDALCQQGVIEIKNRKNRLFEKLPNYERVQLLCYLSLYNASKGYLVESYGKELRKYEISWDAAEWQRLQSACLATVERALRPPEATVAQSGLAIVV